MIARVDVPVLMVAGRQSQYWPVRARRGRRPRTPHGRAVVVEDSGHAVNFDRPDEFNRLLLDFMGEL